MDLDALFGEIATLDPISGDEETVCRPSGKEPGTSREAADLAELFGSVPTGTEYDGEASGRGNSWILAEFRCSFRIAKCRI